MVRLNPDMSSPFSLTAVRHGVVSSNFREGTLDSRRHYCIANLPWLLFVFPASRIPSLETRDTTLVLDARYLYVQHMHLGFACVFQPFYRDRDSPEENISPLYHAIYIFTPSNVSLVLPAARSVMKRHDVCGPRIIISKVKNLSSHIPSHSACRCILPVRLRQAHGVRCIPITSAPTEYLCMYICTS